jgi:hypothetical protein
MRFAEYTGLESDLCPLSFVPVTEIACPVAISPDCRRAFECSLLIKWLLQSPSHPLTREHCSLENMVPLVIGNPSCLFSRLAHFTLTFVFAY